MAYSPSGRRTDLEVPSGFESLLRDLTVRFVNVTPERVDAEIRDMQRRLCEVLALDRSALWQTTPGDPDILHLTHLYEDAYDPVLLAGVPIGPAHGSAANGPGRLLPTVNQPLSEDVRASDAFPWITRQLLAGCTVAVAQVEDLPAEAARDAESLRLAGTLSTVIVPLRTRGLRFGCLTFAMTRMPRSWPRPLVTQFELVAEVFARALTQQQTSHALREHAARLELAVESAHAGSWDLDLAS